MAKAKKQSKVNDNVSITKFFSKAGPPHSLPSEQPAAAASFSSAATIDAQREESTHTTPASASGHATDDEEDMPFIPSKRRKLNTEIDSDSPGDLEEIGPVHSPEPEKARGAPDLRSVQADGFHALIVAKRSKSEKQKFKREPETTDEEVVIVHCIKCKSVQSKRRDPAPQYEISSDKYIARDQSCPTCPKKSSGRSGQKAFVPVDPQTEYVMDRQVDRVYLDPKTRVHRRRKTPLKSDVKPQKNKIEMTPILKSTSLAQPITGSTVSEAKAKHADTSKSPKVKGAKKRKTTGTSKVKSQPRIAQSRENLGIVKFTGPSRARGAVNKVSTGVNKAKSADLGSKSFVAEETTSPDLVSSVSKQATEIDERSSNQQQEPKCDIAAFQSLPHHLAAAELQADVAAAEVDSVLNDANLAQEAEASFATQEAKLREVITSNYPNLTMPVTKFLGKLRLSSPERYPEIRSSYDIYGFKFTCSGLAKVCKPILEELIAFCKSSNGKFALDRVSTPSGTVDSSMIMMAHFPTYKTKFPKYGETADTTNPCVRLLDTAVQGLNRILAMDRIAFRINRSSDTDTPEDLLPAGLIDILTRLWKAVWAASKAVTGVLLGKQQREAYCAAYPTSTPVTLYDKAFYNRRTHVFVEWVPGQIGKVVRRLVYVVYHMESWLKQVWPQTLLGIKESLASALLFAFPRWDIGRTWNLPMLPMTSTDRLFKSILNGTTVSSKLKLERLYDIFDMSVRLLLAKYESGVTLQITDLPDAIQQWALPKVLKFVDNSYNVWSATLARAYHGCDDDDSNPLRETVQFLTRSEKQLLEHRDAKLFTSVLWPAVARLSEKYNEVHKSGTANGGNFISNRFEATVGRKLMGRLSKLKADDHLGVWGPLLENNCKKIKALPNRKYDVNGVSGLLKALSDVQTIGEIKSIVDKRSNRINYAVKKGGSSVDSGFNGLSIYAVSAEAVRLLTMFAGSGWSGKSGVRSFYNKNLSSTITSAAIKIIMQDDYELGLQSTSRWEEHVLGRVLRPDVTKLPRRYTLGRWLAAVSKVELRVARETP